MRTLLLCVLVAGVGGADVIKATAKDTYLCDDGKQFKECSQEEFYKNQAPTYDSERIAALEKRVAQIEKESMIRDLEIKDQMIGLTNALMGRVAALEGNVQKPIHMWPTGCFDGTEPKKNCEDGRNNHYHPTINPHPFGTETEAQTEP